MPTDLDRLLTESLQERANAGSHIDPAPIMRVAVTRGRRIRTRRRVATAVLAVAVVCGIVITGTLAPRKPDPTTPLPAPDPSESALRADNLGVLPDAIGQPGASARPDLVATDRRVVHFSVDAIANGAWRVTWTSNADYESANVQRQDFQAYIAVARRADVFPTKDDFVTSSRTTLSATAPVTIGGRAGTAAHSADGWIWSLGWQPVAGLWANVQVQTPTLDHALEVAETVRFDQAKECALPFSMGKPSGQSTLQSCETSLDADLFGGLFADGKLVFADGQKRLEISTMDAHDGGGDYPRHLKAGPHLAWADPDGKSWTMLVKPVFFTATVTPKHAYTQQQVLDALGTVRMAVDPDNPSTW
jgi:hypothetical protein